jgi:hypothetical protein
VTRVGPRHVFQAGGRGGTPPEGYLARPHTPAPDDEAAESEWGLDPDFRDDVQAWSRQRGYRYTEIGYDGPQTPAGAVATVMRDWYRARGESASRLVVPCFILGDPWQTVCAAGVPFWIHFAVHPALKALDEYLDKAEPYRDVNVFLFEHGTRSPGIATPTTSRQSFASMVRPCTSMGWIHDASRMTLARSVATVGSSINCRGHGIRGVRCLSRTRYTGSQTRISR